MGILDLLSGKKKSKKSHEKVWDEYVSSYFKKYGLAIEMRDLIVRSESPDLPLLIIKKVTEIEKLIPGELVELSEEEQNLEDILQELEAISSQHQRMKDIIYIIGRHEGMVDDVNRVISHMKEALEVLARVLRTQRALITLIKKDPSNKDSTTHLFQSIVITERDLVKAFGSEIEGPEYKNIERIAHAALTNTRIEEAKTERKEREVVFEEEYRLTQRKNRLEKIAAYFNRVLAKLGEKKYFEIFYTQIPGGRPDNPQYGVFIRLKDNKLGDYLITSTFGKDLDRRLRDSQIARDYQLKHFEDRLKQGIRILKEMSKHPHNP